MRRHQTNRANVRNEISALLRRVAFSQTAIRLCEEEDDTTRQRFLLRVLERKIANREERRHARFLHEAAFPVYKTLQSFEFTSVKLPPALSQVELTSMAFVNEKKNLVLFGPAGTGKPHLATALGVQACENGIRTRFFTAAELVVRLSEAYTAMNATA